jgi:hypothetical protein
MTVDDLLLLLLLLLRGLNTNETVHTSTLTSHDAKEAIFRPSIAVFHDTPPAVTLRSLY